MNLPEWADIIAAFIVGIPAALAFVCAIDIIGKGHNISDKEAFRDMRKFIFLILIGPALVLFLGLIFGFVSEMIARY